MTERSTGRSTEHFHVAVVGGGQAGLAVSYHLRQRGLDHVVLDASEHAGDPWRMRWDSLRLFTPARLDHLDGMNFPGPSSQVPTKDEFADYLAAYEQRFELPVRHGTRVHRLFAGDDGFVLDTSISGISADAVVVAMSSLQAPHMPAMAGDLDPSIRSMHSVTYRNPAQLQEGAVLVVGVGNTPEQRSASKWPRHTRRGWPEPKVANSRSESTGSSVGMSAPESSPPCFFTCSRPTQRSVASSDRP